MKWQIFVGRAVFLASLAFTVIIVIGARLAGKARKRRSSLHGKQIGHLPGQQLVTRIDNANEGQSYAFEVMVIALPLFFWVWSTARIDWWQVKLGFFELFFIIGWALTFAFGLWRYLRHSKFKEQAHDGLLAERVTGMQLNRLIANGCLALHDLPCGDFNIDHVVIAPRGVFAVEKKSFRKPKKLPSGAKAAVSFVGEKLRFTDFMTAKPIEQARGQAKFLSNLLRQSLGESIAVTPAVSLPGWWIHKTDAGKSSDVFVFTPMGRGCELFGWGEEVLTSAKRHMIAQALALRYPAIA